MAKIVIEYQREDMQWDADGGMYTYWRTQPETFTFESGIATVGEAIDHVLLVSDIRRGGTLGWGSLSVEEAGLD